MGEDFVTQWTHINERWPMHGRSSRYKWKYGKWKKNVKAWCCCLKASLTKAAHICTHKYYNASMSANWSRVYAHILWKCVGRIFCCMLIFQLYFFWGVNICVCLCHYLTVKLICCFYRHSLMRMMMRMNMCCKCLKNVKKSCVMQHLESLDRPSEHTIHTLQENWNWYETV